MPGGPLIAIERRSAAEGTRARWFISVCLLGKLRDEIVQPELVDLAGIEPYVELLGARLALLQGDTAAAVGRLRAVLDSTPQIGLDWEIGAPLAPDRLLLGGPNLFFRGLQEAWRHHLMKLWAQRKIALPEGRDPASLVIVPAEALYYACLGCVEIGKDEAEGVSVYQGRDKLRWWIDEGQHEQKAKAGGRALISGGDDLKAFSTQWDTWRAAATPASSTRPLW